MWRRRCGDAQNSVRTFDTFAPSIVTLICKLCDEALPSVARQPCMAVSLPCLGVLLEKKNQNQGQDFAHKLRQAAK